MLLASFLFLSVVNSGFGLNRSIGELCVTVSGEDPSKPCVFPFVQEGVTYNECAWSGGHTAWCSTRNDANNVTLRRGDCAGGLPYMMSAKFSDFLTVPSPLCPNSMQCLSANLGYFLTPLPPVCTSYLEAPPATCPIPEKPCMAVIDEIYSDPCVFPFVYKGVTHNTCAWDGQNCVYWSSCGI